MTMSKLLYLLFLCSILFIKSDSKKGDPFQETCPSISCNGIPIKYPFWQIIDKYLVRFCGYPGFGVTCNADQLPLLSLADRDYLIRSIDYKKNNLKLVDETVVFNPQCPRISQNFTLGNLSLSATPSDFHLTMFFDCTVSLPLPSIPIDCFASETIKSYVLEGRSTTEPKLLEWYNYCADKVEVVATTATGFGSNYTELGRQFGKVLNEGLLLKWKRLDECRECEESDGRCGQDRITNDIWCFCKDGTVQSNNPYCKSGKKTDIKLKLGIGLGAAITCILLLCFIYLNRKYCSNTRVSLRGNTKDNQDVEAFIKQYGSSTPKRYSYSAVKKITNSFKHELGKGGYGHVFKGTLPDGRLVAIKVLNETKGNDEEFINEVASTGRTSHVNVVTLLGFCYEGKKRALIYEFMPNGSLEKFINNKNSSITEQNLGLERLYSIAVGIARGLEYLHRGCNTRILHFDIKPHNILLDEDFCPKISDFGLAKLYTKKESIVSIMQARGTIGYIAPEVFNRNFGGVSHKSDVYSYGMMILEMVGERQNADAEAVDTSEKYFPHWIYKHIVLNEEISFANATNKEENEIARKMVIVGLWCIQTDPSERPSISKVIEMLEGSIVTLEIPPTPYLFSPPRSESNS